MPCAPTNVSDELFVDADAIRDELDEVGRLPSSEVAVVDAEADDTTGEDEGVEEGRLRSRLHLVRERKRGLSGQRVGDEAGGPEGPPA